jgi:DNA-binding beta-propeller fold protein YncE
MEASEYVLEMRKEVILIMEKLMRKLHVIFWMFFGAFVVQGRAQQAPPLKLIQTIHLPNVKGGLSHFGLDRKGNRLFATLQKEKSVQVFDLRTMNLLHTIGGFQQPYSVVYREDLDRIYVTDENGGALKIFDGKTYESIKSVELLLDAESMAYDPASHYLYIANGGADEHQTYAFVSIVDANAGAKVADIKIDSDSLKDIVLEKSSPKMYVNNRGKNQVDVIERKTRTLIASWPITLGKGNVPMAFDQAHHRLFVGCRNGQIVIFDTESGKELQALPINEGVDDLAFDPVGKRIYAASGGAGGAVDVFEETDPDHYKSLGKVPTEPGAREGRLVPERGRYFVAVPQRENTEAEILVFETVGERVRRR